MVAIVSFGFVFQNARAQDFNALTLSDVHSCEQQARACSHLSCSLQALACAEHLLENRQPSRAWSVLKVLPTLGSHQTDLVCLQAWTLLELRRYRDVLQTLDGLDSKNSELVYIEAVARIHLGQRLLGQQQLKNLWWAEPNSLFGLASLRMLADTEFYPYSKKERRLVKLHVPRVNTWRTKNADISIGRILGVLSKKAPKRHLLWAEANHALGVEFLSGENLDKAAQSLNKAYAQARDKQFRRIVALRMGQTARRQGRFEKAFAYFKAVTTIQKQDSFSQEALALSAQMAIEYRRYGLAENLFKEQLLQNPAGPDRQQALWGLGWISFRTGKFDQAFQFFDTLFEESPYGRMAPQALFWKARALEEQVLLQRATAIMAALKIRFPISYYAFRANRWFERHAGPIRVAKLSQARADPRIEHVKALAHADMTERAKKLLQTLRRHASHLDPKQLRVLEDVATHVGAPRLAQSFVRMEYRRFPLSTQAMEYLESLFPTPYVNMLEQASVQQRLHPLLAPAVVLQESGFRPSAVSTVGALGLMQLMPRTARDLLAEERNAPRFSRPLLFRPELNIRLGVRYLARMFRSFGRRVEYALAAYNAGPGAVTRWCAHRGELPQDIFVEEIPYEETQTYVKRVLAGVQILQFLHDPQPFVTHTPNQIAAVQLMNVVSR